MEVGGHTLRILISDLGWTFTEETPWLDIMRGIALGLCQPHSRTVAHGDLKPSNGLSPFNLFTETKFWSILKRTEEYTRTTFLYRTLVSGIGDRDSVLKKTRTFEYPEQSLTSHQKSGKWVMMH